jgi:hypothetical protein
MPPLHGLLLMLEIIQENTIQKQVFSTTTYLPGEGLVGKSVDWEQHGGYDSKRHNP